MVLPGVKASWTSRFSWGHFRFAAPRNFRYPALLLLLAEGDNHGYGLAKAFPPSGSDASEGPMCTGRSAPCSTTGLCAP